MQLDLSQYTPDMYLRIVTYKTAFYSFFLPVAAGLALAGVQDEEAYALAQRLCVEMGQYFQVGGWKGAVPFLGGAAVPS